jgi:hypothetical protein
MSTSYDSIWDESRLSYEAGAARVQAKLAALGLPQAHPELLYNGLLDRFDTPDWMLSAALLSSTDPSDWHAIAFPEGSPIQGHEDIVCAASDANAALGYCLELMDIERVFPTEARPVRDGVAFFRGSQLLVSVQRIKFEPYQPAIRGRVENAFKGLRVFGNDDRLIARAKTLPGFAEASYDLEDQARPRARPEGRLLLPYPTNWVVAVRELMTSLSIPVKQHQAQELVAAFFGAASWHQLVRHQNEDRCWLTPCSVYDHDFDLSRRRYYKTAAESAYAFGLALKGQTQRALVIESFSAFLSNNGLYIAAYLEGADKASSSPVLACSGSIVVEPRNFDRYAQEAAGLWQQLGQGDTVSLSLGDWRQDLRRSNQRLDRSEDDALQIGNFYLRKFRLDNRSYLVAEEIVDGQVRFKSHGVALYKAHVRYLPESESVVVLANYGHETAMTIPAVSEFDRVRLSRFLSGELLLQGDESLLSGTEF